VLSSCAGQGHDILGALEERGPQDRARVTGALVEIDPTNVTIARRRIMQLGLALAVVQADAGTTDAYRGLVPADLVLLSGLMGNISAADIERLVHMSAMFCAPAATIIWTRAHRTRTSESISADGSARQGSRNCPATRGSKAPGCESG